MENPFRVIGSLPAFGAFWVSSFLFAMFALFAGNFVFRLPLGEMVDGELAVHLMLLAVAEAFFAVLTLVSLVRGRFGLAARYGGQILAYLLNIFPALLAYDLYAALMGQSLVGQTRIYDWVLRRIDGLLGLGGHHVVTGLNHFMRVDRQVAEPTVEGLRLFAVAVSVLLALLSLVQLLRHMRKGEAAAVAA